MRNKFFLAIVAASGSGTAMAADVSNSMDPMTISVVTAVVVAVIMLAVFFAVLFMRAKLKVKENKEESRDGEKIISSVDGKKFSSSESENNPTSNVATTTSSAKCGADSILSVLESSSMLDPIAAGHGVVILVEMIRHAKATAHKIQDQADTLICQAAVARDRGLELNNELAEAITLADIAKDLASQAIAVKDDVSSSSPGALLIWQRAQFDECLSLLAMARSKLVPAIEKWQVGIEQCSSDLTEQAKSKRVEAERAFVQATNFIEAVQSGFSKKGEDSIRTTAK